LLGVDLPASARQVQYVDWQPSGDLAYHEALVAFELTQEDYDAWIADAGFGPSSAQRPAVWAAPPEIEAPKWWTPSTATPATTVSRTIGEYGSVTMKWEGGTVYAHVVDTGHHAS
jgi:hypothetical protein